jgi:thiamine kinase-like enzyme
MTSVQSQDARLSRIISSFAVKLNLALDPSDLTCTLLSGGMSQATIYRFDLHARSYVLRLLAPQSNRLNRIHQTSMAQEAGRMGIGPEVHFIDSQLEALIMDFIPGRTVHPLDFRTDDQLIKFAQLIRQLHHASNGFPSARSPFQRFDDFLRNGEEKKIVFPLKMAEAKSCMDLIEAILRLHPVPLAPTHLDLNSLNIMLSNDRFFLIDWVNGGMSDPYHDLAIFSVFLGLEEPQIQVFLTHYFGHTPTLFEMSRFVLLKPVRLLVIAAAFLSQPTEGGIEPLLFKDFIRLHAEGKADWPLRQIGMTMLETALDLIDGREFKTALMFLEEFALKK